jgi:hypothetical protein
MQALGEPAPQQRGVLGGGQSECAPRFVEVHSATLRFAG